MRPTYGHLKRIRIVSTIELVIGLVALIIGIIAFITVAVNGQMYKLASSSLACIKTICELLIDGLLIFAGIAGARAARVIPVANQTLGFGFFLAYNAIGAFISVIVLSIQIFAVVSTPHDEENSWFLLAFIIVLFVFTITVLLLQSYAVALAACTPLSSTSPINITVVTNKSSSTHMSQHPEKEIIMTSMNRDNIA